jgi:site-specific recombinase XerD
MDVLHGVRVVGPLVPYARGFAEELTRLGFTPLSAGGQLRLAAHLSRWLAAAGLGVQGLTAATVEAFLVARRAQGYTAFLTPKALVPLLGYLRGLGVAPSAGVAGPPLVGSQALLARYREYLLVERGLQPAVVRGYVDAVRPFVVSLVAAEGVGLRSVNAAEVSGFMVAESRRLAPKSLQRTASALRSLLRFWHLDGVNRVPLVEAVPKVANRRTGLPKALVPEQVRALLDSCDRSSTAGLRDAAILTLLSRLGLRAGEVAALRLEDVDWRAGLVSVRGKGNRCDQLPLPTDAGERVADYLRVGRPATALDRAVFVRVKAPHRGLTSTGVTQAVAAAGRRAGLGTIYAHRLRHSAATMMLAEGGSLAEIGQVLRHRRPLTTAMYAKVNTEALRTLARPWPGTS